MTGQIVFAPSRIYDEVCSRLAGTNTVILPKAAARSTIMSAVKCTAAYKAKLDMLKSENDSLKNTVNEMKLVNRAKCVLMEYLRLTEKEAHRQMQKRAMDNHTTLTEIATDIIKTYEYR
jgi:response regulator NasT